MGPCVPSGSPSLWSQRPRATEQPGKLGSQTGRLARLPRPVAPWDWPASLPPSFLTGSSPARGGPTSSTEPVCSLRATMPRAPDVLPRLRSRDGSLHSHPVRRRTAAPSNLSTNAVAFVLPPNSLRTADQQARASCSEFCMRPVGAAPELRGEERSSAGLGRPFASPRVAALGAAAAAAGKW